MRSKPPLPCISAMLHFRLFRFTGSMCMLLFWTCSILTVAIYSFWTPSFKCIPSPARAQKVHDVYSSDVGCCQETAHQLIRSLCKLTQRTLSCIGDWTGKKIACLLRPVWKKDDFNLKMLEQINCLILLWSKRLKVEMRSWPNFL